MFGDTSVDTVGAELLFLVDLLSHPANPLGGSSSARSPHVGAAQEHRDAWDGRVAGALVLRQMAKCAPPPNVSSEPEYGSLHGERDFAHVIQDLETGD